MLNNFSPFDMFGVILGQIQNNCDKFDAKITMKDEFNNKNTLVNYTKNYNYESFSVETIRIEKPYNKEMVPTIQSLRDNGKPVNELSDLSDISGSSIYKILNQEPKIKLCTFKK